MKAPATPSAPREVVLRALHVVYNRGGEAVKVDVIADQAEMPRGAVLAVLLELRDERLARTVKKHPDHWLPWDSGNVSLGLALEILRGLPVVDAADDEGAGA